MIQIITKKGQPGSPAQWTVSLRQGAAWFQNPDERFAPAFGRNGTGQIFSVRPYQLSIDQGSPAFRTSHLQGYGVNISGGGQSVDYYASGELDRDEGNEPTNDLTQYRGRLNLGLIPSDRLRLNFSTSYLAGTARLPADGSLGGAVFALQLADPSQLDDPVTSGLYQIVV